MLGRLCYLSLILCVSCTSQSNEIDSWQAREQRCTDIPYYESNEPINLTEAQEIVNEVYNQVPASKTNGVWYESCAIRRGDCTERAASAYARLREYGVGDNRLFIAVLSNSDWSLRHTVVAIQLETLWLLEGWEGYRQDYPMTIDEYHKLYNHETHLDALVTMWE